jgi:hypothetical protein
MMMRCTAARCQYVNYFGEVLLAENCRGFRESSDLRDLRDLRKFLRRQ